MNITSPSQIPETEHWQIIIFDTVITFDSDANEGRGGYYRKPCVEVLVFTNEESLRQEILKIEHKNYRVQKVTPCVVVRL